MADSTELGGKTKMSAADRVSDQEFLGAAARLDETYRKPVENSDWQASGEKLLQHSNAPHAIVVLARARALRIRQAATNP